MERGAGGNVVCVTKICFSGRGGGGGGAGGLGDEGWWWVQGRVTVE